MSHILKDAMHYVSDLMNEKLNPDFIYHNFAHTQFVVDKISEIAKGENLSSSDTEMLLLAGWFHDTGYAIDIKKHENHSISIAKSFLEKKEYDPEKIEIVCDAILGTIHKEIPKNYFQQVLSDADFAHLSIPEYKSFSKILKLEFEATCKLFFTKKEWLNENINVFKHQKYYTLYAKKHWTPLKSENLVALTKGLKKELKKNKNEKRSERSIDTLFRVTLKNHITLSDIADTKANILLSVNAIIISMALSNLLPKFDNPANEFLIFPTVVFICFSVASIVLSVIATRPSVTSGIFTKQDIKDKKVNILFFGNFHKMTLNDFEAGINEVMNDKEYLYSSMSKDLFFLGKVLARKYKILRITYTVFMIGIILSVISFSVSYKYLCPTY